ncbi:MAG: HEAT repeat domain-containing protein [Chloroflexota bacterium]|nr:HEAT repeat domain-containing protein [Chloroflexota bacterium]
MESYFAELVDKSKPLMISKLTKLSALTPANLDLFCASWGEIPTERRQDVVGHLITLAEGDPDLDFDDLFLIGIHDPDETVREKSIDGLWEYERSPLIDPLIKILRRDPCEPVRAAAITALGKFALLSEFGKLRPKDEDKVVEALLEVTRNYNEEIDIRRRAVEAISSLSVPVVVETISEAYSSKDGRMKISAIYAMGMNSDPAWLPILIKEMASPDPELRFEAARACGEIEDAQAVPQLLKLIRDPDTQVRIAAIDALGKIGGEDAEAALQECAKHAEEYVRDAAADALRELYFNRDPFSTETFE